MAAGGASRPAPGCGPYRAGTSTSRSPSSVTGPRASWTAIAGELRAAAAAAAPIRLTVERYRETRSVGMLVFADEDGAAAALAGDLHGRLERIGVYERESRPWLPHLTVVRFRSRPRLRPEPPALGSPAL